MEIIERVERGEKVVDVAHSYNMINSRHRSKEQGQDHGTCKSAVPMMLAIIAKKPGNMMEKLLSVRMQDAGSASVSCPIQRNANSRES